MQRKRRIIAALITAVIGVIVAWVGIEPSQPAPPPSPNIPAHTQVSQAAEALGHLAIKGRAPKTGYSRTQFSNGWGDIGGCDVRNVILKRDLTDITLSQDGCTVLSGTLQDKYTGGIILFTRGPGTSDAVQIDHVVAASDAWQKGAQQLSADQRQAFYNDPLNLLAVDGPTNNKKGDSDAASWLPPNKAYRCQYVARQIAVKAKYTLWVTQAEHDAMRQVLNACPDQLLPVAGE